MTENAIKLDSQLFTPFQKELHRRRGEFNETKSEVIPIPDVTTTFQHRFKKISWYTPIKKKLEMLGTSDEASYLVDSSMDHLFKTFLKVTLPPLSIKPKFRGRFRIAWTHNVGINIVNKAELFAGNIVINSFDNIGHDILSQYGYLTKPGFKKHHLISIGSVPKLESWAEHLPAHQMNVLQPFHYSKAGHLALPLLGSNLTTFRHVYKFRTKILDLLRMQRYDSRSESWVDIRPIWSVVKGIKTEEERLKTPELWGRYGKITDEERDWLRECKIKHSHYYDDLVVCDETNAKRYGDTVTISLKTPNPVKALFWVGENVNSTKLNNYSNYTTNDKSIYMGWNPCANFRMDYSPSSRIEDTTYDHAEKEESWEFPRAPWEPGYNAVTFCNAPFSIDGEPSLDLQGRNASLIIKLGNTDPNLVITDEPEIDPDTMDDLEIESRDIKTETNGGKEETPEFKIRSRLLVYRKLTYHYQGGGWIFTSEDLDRDQVWYDDEIKRLKEESKSLNRDRLRSH